MVGPHIRVLVVSDVRLYRDGIAGLLAAQSVARISGMGGPLEAIVEAIEHRAPDVVLLDAALPEGPAVTRAIRARTPGARVVAIAASDGDLLQFAEAGIAGYVSRDGSAGDVVAAIASVERGEALCSPRAAAALLERVAALAREPAAAGESLTAREHEILDLITAGLSNKEIATRLFIGVPTVKTHVHNILRKLGASRRGQAAARARAVA